MNKILIPIVLALAVLASGCALIRGPVPANTIKIQAPVGTYYVNTPKNVIISNFAVGVDTNGIIRLTFEKWVSTNDPQVIDSAGAARVAEWNAISGLINSGIETGIKAAATK